MMGKLLREHKLETAEHCIDTAKACMVLQLPAKLAIENLKDAISILEEVVE